ncbi:hypothetical protein NDU88_006422 [Pleurodeles waltl]|uniref:Uncharacterized protein n=1 Tax=Pleurodeles waltl TaxID=8319 RepID=A0AAV7UL06_PLEWA|nr:hypothetical protein NDU88_006422 [Pleurodeles waltl]
MARRVPEAGRRWLRTAHGVLTAPLLDYERWRSGAMVPLNPLSGTAGEHLLGQAGGEDRATGPAGGCTGKVGPEVELVVVRAA